ncbi:hypothetical protein Mar181_1995 [Marinomonas posidonica IVIA-Po-181]|uniref:Uncharacterized protein n=2 Tax=Marinomonas TaxID=28253 RepID=F6CSH9_MARPP|nr:hypothetical protein Mar181_1995 [Marinomonas posidonica IVIA-Po-181]
MLNASSLVLPQMSSSGINVAQTFGLAGSLKMAQRKSSRSWTQVSPAALPFGIPGMAELIDGAVQQAPQPDRHCMFSNLYCN